MWQAEKQWERNQNQGHSSHLKALHQSQALRCRDSISHFLSSSPRHLEEAGTETVVIALSQSRESVGPIQIQSDRFMFHCFSGIPKVLLPTQSYNLQPFSNLTRSGYSSIELQWKRLSFFLLPQNLHIIPLKRHCGLPLQV